MYRFDANGQLMMLELEAAEGTGAPPKRRPGKPDSELISIPYFYLDLRSGHVDLFGQRHWELRSPYRHNKRPLNTGVAPRKPIRASLSSILEAYPALKYYLSKTACMGILRRAFERGKGVAPKAGTGIENSVGAHAPGRTAHRIRSVPHQPARRGHRSARRVRRIVGNDEYADADLRDAAGRSCGGL